MVRPCVVFQWCFIHLTLQICPILTKEDAFIAQNLKISEIAEQIIKMFRVSSRVIRELQHKIDKINSYVVDNTFALTNVTSATDLNETNFFEALNERDAFTFMSNDTKNLYLKLKSKMTRDDMLKILATRGEKGKLMKTVRRMMQEPIEKKMDVEKINEVVDKMLAEVPKDTHKEKAKQSIYWDPQGELEDMKEYHEAKKNGRRIFNGERTNVREYPFMASIHIMGRFWCGGALYWHDLVLTSASCLQLMYNNRFFRENPRILAVRLGSNHSRVGGETIDVIEVYFHPSYSPRTLANNLAVVRLRRHLSFIYRIPRIIDISHLPSSIPTTTEITMLGWGVTKMSQKLAFEPIFLQKKVLPVYPNIFCKEVYGDKFITDKMFCAGTFSTGEGACDHDAGGPAILYGRLVGIISFGPAVCGYENAPTVFTLVGAFADWIETINETMPSYYKSKALTTTTTMPVFQEFFNTWTSTVQEQPTRISIQPILESDSKINYRIENTDTTHEPTENVTESKKVENETTSNPTPKPTPEEKVLNPRADYDDGWSIEIK